MSAPGRHWLASPVESGAAAGFGLYVHVPFCSHRCGYCDFATVAVGERPADAPFERYVEALVVDLARQVARLAPLPAVTSVFVGGGTPSLLPADLVERLLGAIRRECDVVDGAEFTVEANPESADPAFLEALVAGGAERVSIGAQSWTPSVLATLERGHDAAAVERAVVAARRAGLPRVSVDLIHGTPGERESDWVATLDAVAGLGIDHVSAYALGIHPGTPFGRAVAAGTMAPPDDDDLRVRFELARERLGAAGFEHYELSNWARGTAARSRHNVLYWRHGDYLGVGVGAHAHLDGHRWWTTRAIERYLSAVESGGTGAPASPGAPDRRAGAGAEASEGVLGGEERLSEAERATERLLLGLRLADGIHPADLPPIDPLALEDALAAGLVETSCGRLRATRDGWFLLDEAVARLTP
jgi:putative oxygen-independent coproporphyrinogen III oxidase